MFRAPSPPRPVAAGSAPSAAVPSGSSIEPAPARPQLAELERLIREFSRQTERRPNATGLAFLGRLELERARLTGDVGGYSRAERALAAAYELSPGDPEVGSSLASVRYTMHDFVGARSLADEIYRAEGDLGALAVRADAELELGAYDRARADYEALAAALPGAAAVEVRLARLAELTGSIEEAERRLRLAERAARGEGAFGATLSWYVAARARLALLTGRVEDALRLAARAVRTAPGYHVAVAGAAAAYAADGRTETAIRRYERAIRIVPDPAYLAAVGDLYAITGRPELAEEHYRTVEAIATLARANRQLYELQLAVFWADHDRNLEEALEIAERTVETRQSLFAYDALGWVRYRLGRFEEAREASDRALSLGTPDPRLWYHAGMISAALGETDRARAELARALSINPAFDPLQAPVAREALERLGGAP